MPTAPASDLAPTMEPGTYLRKRREAAGLSRREAAAALAIWDATIMLPAATLIDDRAALLAAAEAGADNLTARQVILLRCIFPLDSDTYFLLLWRAHGADGGLPLPRICRSCGCSWTDPCVGRRANCAWSATEPDLCAACEARPAATAPISVGITDNWPDAPLPEGVGSW